MQRGPEKGLSRVPFCHQFIVSHDTNSLFLTLAAPGGPKALRLSEPEGTAEKLGCFSSLDTSLCSAFTEQLSSEASPST